MRKKERERLLRSATERRIAVFKAIKLDVGYDFEQWTNRNRAKSHLSSNLQAYCDKEISLYLKLKLLWQDQKCRLRWTKLGRRVCKQILRQYGFILHKVMGFIFEKLHQIPTKHIAGGSIPPASTIFFVC